MVSKWLLALVVPVAIVIFLWYTHTPPFEITTTTTTLRQQLVQDVGFVWRWYHMLGGLILIGILYYLNQKAKEYISYPEEQIKEMLRAWLKEYEGIIIDDIHACVYDPEAKHELTRIVFTVKEPEKYVNSWCYITFHRGRFEGLQKHLNYARCEELLGRRMRYMPKIAGLKKSSWLDGKEEKK